MQLLPYSQLLQQSNNEDAIITYFEKLQTIEWHSKRQEIINRDNHVCQICRNGQTIARYNCQNKKEYFFVRIPDNTRRYRIHFLNNGELDCFYIYDERDFVFTPSSRHSYLHVHHTFYNLDLQPWEYEAHSLITLCVHCHFHLHETTQIPVYRRTPEGNYEKVFLTPCSRCNGAGILPQFDYYMNGVCFNCWGAKYNELITPQLKRRSKEVYDKMKMA